MKLVSNFFSVSNRLRIFFSLRSTWFIIELVKRPDPATGFGRCYCKSKALDPCNL